MTGDFNTGIGYSPLVSNTTGASNVAIGVDALNLNTTGTGNTASGTGALAHNTSGSYNTAFGGGALGENLGSNNIGVGMGAGNSLTTGDYNICVGSGGVAGESNTIRIGSNAQAATFIAGISGRTSAGGVQVLISGDGKLGTDASSRRFKMDFRNIGKASEGLMKLRPVAFRYKPEYDPSGAQEYGLIAEEVAEVYPELVAYDRDDQPLTVRYHLLVPMLLNEVQRQHRTVQLQEEKIDRQQAEIERLKTDLSALRALVGQR